MARLASAEGRGQKMDGSVSKNEWKDRNWKHPFEATTEGKKRAGDQEGNRGEREDSLKMGETIVYLSATRLDLIER